MNMETNQTSVWRGDESRDEILITSMECLHSMEQPYLTEIATRFRELLECVAVLVQRSDPPATATQSEPAGSPAPDEGGGYDAELADRIEACALIASSDIEMELMKKAASRLRAFDTFRKDMALINTTERELSVAQPKPGDCGGVRTEAEEALIALLIRQHNNEPCSPTTIINTVERIISERALQSNTKAP